MGNILNISNSNKLRFLSWSVPLSEVDESLFSALDSFSSILDPLSAFDVAMEAIHSNEQSDNEIFMFSYTIFVISFSDIEFVRPPKISWCEP